MKVEDSNEATIGEYEYDALMRRVEEDGKKLFQSANWQVVEERNATGETTAQYTWSPVYVDAMVAKDRDTNPGTTGLEERLYVQQDANFNVTSVSDDQGDIVERYIYDPYGERTVLDENWEERPGNVSEYNFQHGHQGGKHNDATGLMHFRNREYSPTLMRWMQQDPLGYVDGMSNYQAYLSNPIINQDPFGLESINDDTGAPEDDTWLPTGVYSDGTVVWTNDDGETVVITPDGTEYYDDGTIIWPDGSIDYPDTPETGTDVFVGLEMEAVLGIGGEAGAGIVINTETGDWHWYSSAGFGVGLNFGISGGIGTTMGGRMDGDSQQIDMNLGMVSPTGGYGLDANGNTTTTNIFLGAGVGGGIHASIAKTETTGR